MEREYFLALVKETKRQTRADTIEECADMFQNNATQDTPYRIPAFTALYWANKIRAIKDKK